MRRRLLSDINVTPLVDVMLVLLIIFMITVPMMKEGIVMDLPRAKATALKLKNKPVIISVKKGQIYLENRRVKLSRLEREIKMILMSRGSSSFVIEASRKTEFEKIVKILAILKSLGIDKVGIATVPERHR